MKLVVGLTIAMIGGLIMIGHFAQQDPQAQKLERIRDAEKICWHHQQRKSLDPVQAARIAAYCELFEGLGK